MQEIKQILKNIAPLNPKHLESARQRLDQLTKPKGSLGRLEDVACQVVAISENLQPVVEKKIIYVLAADHGVVEEGVSAYPQAVTTQMVYNYLRGGAAINVLVRQIGAEVRVVDMGVNHDFQKAEGLIQRKVGHGTRNFVHGPAMSEEEATKGVLAGFELARQAREEGFHLIGTGEMGIGNTTASSALLAVLLECEVDTVTGFGTGLSLDQRQHKIEVIQRAIDVNRSRLTEPLSVLAALGGFEIAGLCGLMLGGAALRLPVVVDGFITSVAALLAVRLQPFVKEYLFFAHQSREPGHRRLLHHSEARPLLDLDMCLGEGTGAALAMHVIEAAVRVYNEMATFEEAGVSQKV